MDLFTAAVVEYPGVSGRLNVYITILGVTTDIKNLHHNAVEDLAKSWNVLLVSDLNGKALWFGIHELIQSPIGRF